MAQACLDIAFRQSRSTKLDIAPLVRRLLAILLILWLPLQAAASLFVPACAGHGPGSADERLSQLDLARSADSLTQFTAHDSHRMHAGAASADGTSPASLEACGACSVLCAPYLATVDLGHAASLASAAVDARRPGPMVSAPARRLHRPPIAAA